MGSRSKLSILAVALATTLVLAAVAWANTTTQTASAGNVAATFTFNGGLPNVSQPQLTIDRAGQELYNQPVYSKQCTNQCGPGVFGPHASSVRVLDIESDHQPDVILELFTGGASCCFLDQVFSFDPGTTTYVKTEHDFQYGATIEKAAHRWLFKSADGNFLCAFTDCADSGQPIQFWNFKARRFHDVTRRYRKQIASDASRWLRLFKSHIGDGVGLIAAWAGDEELLGQDKLVQSTLAAEAAKGDLRDGSNGLATGHAFIARLNKLLHKLGYKH